MKGVELEKLTEPQMLERVNLARFPQDLTIPQKKIVAKVSIDYGLDPLMDELTIIHGALYVTMSARLRKAQETDRFNGISTRPATDDEKKGRRYADEDDLWIAEVRVKDADFPFVAYGGVKKKEVDKATAIATSHRRDPEALPLVKDSAQHAEKRAICRALKMAFHLPLPSAEDIGSEENGAESSVVIIEGEKVEPKPAPQIDNEAPKTKSPAPKTSEPKGPRNLEEEAGMIGPPEKRGPGCATCDYTGWVAANNEGIPCPDCFGKPGTVGADAPPEPEPSPEAKGSNPPQTAGELLMWVASHGKEYDKTWVMKSFGWADKDLNNRLIQCYKDIIALTGWDPR